MIDLRLPSHRYKLLHVLIYCIIDKIEILFVIGTNFAITGPDHEVKVCQHSFSFDPTDLEVEI